MGKVSLEDVKKMRELTGVGLTDAKAALVEAGGDFDKALEQMKAKGLAKAAKRADREAAAGIVGTYSHDGRIGVAVEVNCETDFVAKTDEFKELVKDLTLHIAASDPADIEELLEQPYIKNPEQSVEDLIKDHIAKLGENIVIRRFARLSLGESD
jgi:elongation factor Ts